MCLGVYTPLCYSATLSTVYRSNSLCFADPLPRFVWTDLDIAIVGYDLLIGLTNENRSFLDNPATPRHRPALVPWMGASAHSFAELRSMCISRVARGSSQRRPPVMVFISILELVLEMHLLGYPATLLRALVHSLPPTRPARALRTLLRYWQKWAMGGSEHGLVSWEARSGPGL